VRYVPIRRDPLGPSNRLLPSSFLGFLRAPAPGQNPTKIGQKSIYFHECEFFNSSATTTYNFDLSKQTGFPVSTAFWGEAEGQTGSLGFASLPLCAFAFSPRPKLNKTERFRTEWPEAYWTEVNKTE
jgi:hypothetical protein